MKKAENIISFNIKSILRLLAVTTILSILPGCETPQAKPDLQENIAALENENAELTRQLEDAEKQNEKLKEQITSLTGVREGIDFESLYDIKSVKIGKYTNLYDKDKDGKVDKLIVYLTPMDQFGDAIKAPGAVEIKIFDLAKEKPSLAEWHTDSEELKKLWLKTFAGVNYRLTFDISDIIEKYSSYLIVKITFTDYLTGKIYDVQKIISPQ